MRLQPLAVVGGTMTFDIEHQGATGVIVVDVYEEDGRMCFGITQLVAKIETPPKRWLRLVRSAVAELSDWARRADCSEIRIAGRDWSRVLPDFEPFDGPRNGLRKAL